MSRNHIIGYVLTIFVLIIISLYLPPLPPDFLDLKPPDPPYNLVFVPIFCVLVFIFDFLDKKKGETK